MVRYKKAKVIDE